MFFQGKVSVGRNADVKKWNDYMIFVGHIQAEFIYLLQ